MSLAGSQTEQLELNGKMLSTVSVNGKPYVTVKQVVQAAGGDEHKKANTFVIGSRLDRILKKGVIRVGTTGDYKPFTYFNPKTKEYEGYDIEAAKLMAADLGVKITFVKTTWPTLMEDLHKNKFDIAVGGISRNTDRQKQHT